ncbi:LptF/LptG family permease [Treponema berlinense]|uniref:LptF/LptG family permease n=1 Tax=Treponema berlinense TaxID=225004 RepID=UPI0026EBC573|nr:LptF/LptG family permease [Treponema berlinense]
MKFDRIEAFLNRIVGFFRRLFCSLKNRLSSLRAFIKAKKTALHIESFGYYYTRFLRKSRLCRKIRWFYKNKFKPFWAGFNLLNSIFHRTACLLRLVHLYRAADFFDGAMQEKSGINRHVFYRYLLKELFLYFFVAFLFFFFIFFVNQILLVIQKILEKKVPLWDVIRLMTYALPSIIAQSAPFATLVGFLMCLGRLVSENEILIFRASGQSYKTILLPVIFLGGAISVGSFFVNDYLLPLGTIKYNSLYRSILSSNPSVELEPNSVKKTVDKTLVIGNVTNDQVSDLIFFDTGTDEQQRIIIAGKSVVKKSKDPGVLMTLDMNDATVLLFDRARRGNYDVLSSQGMNLNIFESSISSTSSRVSPREMTSYDLHKKIKEMETSGEFTQKKLNSYKLEYNKKFSLPFGSIFFAFLALPLALLFGKHNGQTIGLIIGIVICVLYWTMMILGQIFGNRGGLNGFAVMWAPNLAITLAGGIFYIKLIGK